MNASWSGQQVLTLEISEEMVSLINPKEASLFTEIADLYFENPNKFISEKQNTDAFLGAGDTFALITPAVIAAVEAVINYICLEVLKIAKDEAVSVLREKLRDFFKDLNETDKTTPLNHSQIEIINSLAKRKAIEFGMKPDKAKQMAEALIGSIILKINR